MFSCRVGRNRTGPPNHVSLVTPNTRKLSNLLPVEVPAPSEEKVEFGLCLKTLYRKQDAFRLVEWLEAHRMWGVGEVNFYVTTTDDVTERILRNYS